MNNIAGREKYVTRVNRQRKCLIDKMKMTIEMKVKILFFF